MDRFFVRSRIIYVSHDSLLTLRGRALSFLFFVLKHPFHTRDSLLSTSVLPLLHTLPCLLLFLPRWVYVSNNDLMSNIEV